MFVVVSSIFTFSPLLCKCNVLNFNGPNLFSFNFRGHKFFLWGHGYPCFGLLIMSPQGFKVRVGSLILNWQRCMRYMFPEIHLWCYTCHTGCQVDLFHIPTTRHWWDSNGRPIAPQATPLPNIFAISHLRLLSVGIHSHLRFIMRLQL